MITNSRKFNAYSNSFLPHLLETINGLLIVIQPKEDFKIKFINNSKFLEELGHSTNSLLGKSLLDLIHSNDIEKAKDFLINNVNSDNGMIQLRILNLGAKDKWVEISKKTIGQESFKDKIIVYLTDISKQKELELQLEKMSKDITALKLAEQELKNSEEKYRDLTEFSPDIIFETDTNLNLTYVNSVAFEKFGYTQKEVKDGLNIAQLIDPEYIQKATSKIKIIFEGKKTEPDIYLLRKKDGCSFYARIHTRPVIENEHVIGMRGTLTDINDLMLAEQGLKESEEKYRLITENSQDIVYTLDINLNNTYISPSVSKVLGYSVDEAILMHPRDNGHEDDLEKIARIFKEEFKLERKKGLQKDLNRKNVFTIREKHKDGRTLIMEHTISWLRDENEIAIGILGVAREVSDKKKTEKLLKESEEKYRLISENANDLIAILDTKLNYEYINKGYELLGYSKEEIYNNLVTDIIHPEDVNRATAAFTKGLTTGSGSEELRLRHKDGTYYWFEVQGQVFKDKNEEPKALLISRDITERKEFEKQLKNSEEKYRFLSENTDDLIVVYDENLRVEYSNEATHERILGYSPMQLRELPARTSLIHEDDINQTGRAFQEGFHTGKFKHQLRVKHRDGHSLWFETRGRTFINQEGKIKMLAASRDITDIKTSEEKYRSLFENMNAGFAYHEVVVNNQSQPIDYIYREVNPAFEKLTGMKKEDLIGKRVTEAIPGTENDPADWIGKFGKVALTGTPLTVEDYSEAIDRWFKVSGYSPKKGFFAVTVSDITEIKKAEESLRESELKFSTIAEKSLLGIAILQDDQFKYINQKFANIADRTVDEMSTWNSSNFIKFVHPEDRNIVLEQARKRQLGSDTKVTGYECRAFKKNGELMWVQTYSKTITFNGKFADLITILDITDRKLAEQKLKESESQFRTIAEQSLMGICIIQDFEIKYVNQQMADIYGYPLEEVNNWEPKEFIKVVHPDSRDMAVSQLTKKQQGDTNAISHYIAKIITKNGNIKWVENYSTPIIFQGRSADLLTQIDITSKIEAENKISTSEEKYHHLFESSPYAIILLNIRGEVIDCNLTSERLSGFSKDDIVGKNFQNVGFIPKKHIPVALEDFKQLLKENTIEPKEIQLYTKKGELKWVSYHASIFYIEKEIVFQIIIQEITDRKKAEKKLIESEEKYHILFETSPNGVLLTDLKGMILECNSAIESIFGYSPDVIIGQRFMDLEMYKENGLEILLNGFKDLFSENKLRYVELPVQHKEGHTVWVHINSSIISVKEQNYILAVIYNITTQKAAEEAIKKSQEKYRDLLQTSSVGVVEIDISKSKLTYINPKLLNIIGYERDELNEDIFTNKLVHQKDLSKILRSNEESEVEFRIFDKQGRLKWLSGRRIPSFNENNELISIRVWLDDITEKKMYEELIYELNINFLNFTTDIRHNIDLLLNTGLKLLNGDLILYAHKLDSEGEDKYQIITSEGETYTFESTEFKEKLIISDLLIEGHDFPQMFFDIDVNKFADSDPFIKNVKARGCFGKVIKSQEGLENLVCVFYKDNPLISGQDKLVLFLICDAIEIEQRRWQVQQDLEKQNITLDKINKLKTELFSRTSHELKTPLISIKGFTELLLTLHKSKLDTETISILEEIKDGGRRLEKIINLLLESSKLEAGQLELNRAKEDLTFLINFCVKELKGLARLRNQTILFDDTDEVEAFFDKERIYEVISNLLLNAVKYTPPGGNISIQTQTDDDAFIISVKDNGIGFTEEEKKQVFKQFGKIERYGQGWDVAIEGTGLGLYITKKLVELHDGKIWLESEGRNKGTTFFFSIPKL